MMDALISMHMELRRSYGPEESGCPQWIRGDKLELLPRALKDIVLGSERTELGGWLSYGIETYLLLFASTRKAVVEKIVPASDNKKKYCTKAQKDVFEISKRDITISMMRNYPQLPHKFMSDKAKIHYLLEIIVHMNPERDSLKRQDQNFPSAVLLKKKAFLKHGVKEALRSCVKALDLTSVLCELWGVTGFCPYQI